METHPWLVMKTLTIHSQLATVQGNSVQPTEESGPWHIHAKIRGPKPYYDQELRVVLVVSPGYPEEVPEIYLPSVLHYFMMGDLHELPDSVFLRIPKEQKNIVRLCKCRCLVRKLSCISALCTVGNLT